MTYSYRCSVCEKVFDVVKSMADYAREELCCEKPAERHYTPTPVHFNGGGWHNKTYGGSNSSSKPTGKK